MSNISSPTSAKPSASNPNPSEKENEPAKTTAPAQQGFFSKMLYGARAPDESNATGIAGNGASSMEKSASVERSKADITTEGPKIEEEAPKRSLKERAKQTLVYKKSIVVASHICYGLANLGLWVANLGLKIVGKVPYTYFSLSQKVEPKVEPSVEPLHVEGSDEDEQLEVS